MRVAVAVSLSWLGACGCAQIADPEDWIASSGAPATSSVTAGGSVGSSGTGGGVGGTGGGGCGGDPQRDGGPCGACGVSCLGGACVEGRCQPVELAADVVTYGHLAVDADTIYWGRDGALLALQKNAVIGTQPEGLAGVAAGVDMLVAGQGEVFWSGYFSGVIGRYASGSWDGTAATGEVSPFGIALRESELFWAEYQIGGAIRSMVVMPSSTPTTLVNAVDIPVVAAVDAQDVFYTHRAGEGVDGGVSTVAGAVLAEDQYGVSGLAVNATHIYWITYEGYVRRADKHGGEAVDIAGPYDGGMYVGEVALDDTHVYWTGPGKNGCFAAPCACEPNCGKLFRAPLAEGDAEVVAEGPWTDINCIAVDSAAVYWTTGNPSALWRLAKQPR